MTKLSEMVKTIRQMSTLLKEKPMQKEQPMKRKLSEIGSKNKHLRNKRKIRSNGKPRKQPQQKPPREKLKNKQRKIEKEKIETETTTVITIEDMETKITMEEITKIHKITETEEAKITIMETVARTMMITTTQYKKPKLKEKENPLLLNQKFKKLKVENLLVLLKQSLKLQFQ